MHFRFLNTWEPVVPLYRDLFPALAARGHEAEAWLAAQPYRDANGGYPDVPGTHYRELATGEQLLPQRFRKRLTHVGWSANVATRSLLGAGADLNVFLTQPPLFQLWGRVLQALRGDPYAMIAMDLYPWVAIEAGVLPRDGFVTRRLISVARAALTGARVVFAIGRCMEDRLLDVGVAPSRIVRVHNWVDDSVVTRLPRKGNALRERLGLGDRFVVMYSGNLGVSHDFDALIEVMRRMAHREDLAFVVAGQGSRRQELEAAAARHTLSNLHLLDYQPADQLGTSLGLGDVHFVTVRAGFEGLVVPSKSYGVFAAGRPMIYEGATTGEIARMINEHDLGTTIPAADADALESAIEAMLNDRKAARAQGKRARALIDGELNRARMIETYIDALEFAGR